MGFPSKNNGIGCYFLLQGLPNPGIEPRSPALQASLVLQVDSLPIEPSGKMTSIIVITIVKDGPIKT